MQLLTRTLSFHSNGHCDVIDLTDRTRKELESTGLSEGMVNLFANPGSTAGLSTLEFEPNLVKDLQELMERLAPYRGDYHHHRTWGDCNGASHLRSTLMGPSLTVPFRAGQLELGTWQQIIFCDFDDRAQPREVICTFIGQ